MFLSNTNSKFNDSSQLNSSSSTTNTSSNSFKFPTLILENLLQNNDILETLFKPIANNDNDIVIDDTKLDDKLNFFEQKNVEGNDDSSKIYGNAFLGPSLWNKNELFPSDKFNVKLEYLDVQEFLAENELNGNDVDFLNELQNMESNPITTTTTKTTPNTSMLDMNNHTTVNNSISLTLPQPIMSSIKKTPIITPIDNDTNSNTLDIDINLLDVGSPKFNFEAINNDLKDLLQSVKAQVNEDISYGDNENWNAKNTEFLDDDLNDDDDDDDDTMFSDDQLFANMSQLSGEETGSRKSKKQFVPNELKDEKYWIRRRKNNLAAKRSRDARRMKENQVALRAAFLERENASLKRQLDDCKRETKILKTRLARYEPRKE